MAGKLKIGLLGWIAIAIVAGIVCGLFFPAWAVQVFATFNALFFQFLGFVIPLIILCLITPAIAELGTGAGKWLGITAVIAYGSTLFAGFMAFAVSMLVFPLFVRPDASLTSLDNPEGSLLPSFFTLEVSPVFGVMTALVLAFVLGVGITATKATTLQQGFVEAREIINLVITKIIIPGADSTGRRNTLLTAAVFNDGDGGLEEEDQRCARGCASAVACRSGTAVGDALTRTT